MGTSTFKKSRDVYLQGLRLLWSPSPVDQARARGQITHDEHRSIVDAIRKKHQARENLTQHWVVNDTEGREVAQINQKRDGTFVVRALVESNPEPVVCTSQEQAYQWIDSLAVSTCRA